MEKHCKKILISSQKIEHQNLFHQLLILLIENNIFIEEGATLNFATLNASSGPIYIGRNAEIMEGSIVRGPFALCNNATIKIRSKNLWTNYYWTT